MPLSDKNNVELEEIFNINSKGLLAFDVKYKVEPRVLRSIHETPASISGYYNIGKAYINRETNEVCWFDTFLFTDKENDVSYVKAKSYDITMWASAEGYSNKLDYFKEHMDLIMSAFEHEVVFVMEYVKGGKHFEKAKEWHNDRNQCLFYPLSEEEVIEKIPKEIY